MKARLIKRAIPGYNGVANLYRCEPPLEGHEYVVVSAAEVMFIGPETYIFPGNAEGEVTDLGELGGSYRGGLDHARALWGAGYEVVA